MGNKIIIPQFYLIKDKDTDMKIKQITIDNICGINHLDINFNEGLNLICGENGVGKTTILKSIAYQFSDRNDIFIKKRFGTKKGCFVVKTTDHFVSDYETEEFAPYISSNKKKNNNDKFLSKDIIYFSSSRNIGYDKIESILPSDSEMEIDMLYNTYELLNTGVKEDIKRWFIQRFIFSKLEDSLNEFQQKNLKLCEHIFTLLNNNLSVKTIIPELEIILNDRGNEIYFEMLSDGYKSCIFILLGIVKEIEHRLPQTNAIDFDGIIMIDEIDIHLHPQWQAKLVKVLKETFPKAQIIATTHSPSVLQNATAEEIIPLYKDENGDVHIKELQLGEYGLQGWTLEEIMKDVMGMESTKSDLYNETISKFDIAISNGDQNEIINNYEILKNMYHPLNPMLQLLEMQVAEWKT